MNVTARDKKIALLLAPVALIAVYWMFVLAPKRDEAAKLGTDLVQAEQARDQAQAQAGTLQGAKANYANDYAVVVRLGKAIPTTVDMPSLIVQLDRAAKGTGIQFSKVVAGARTEAATATAATADQPAGDAPAAQPGGEQAQTGFGKTAEKAGEAGQTSDERNAAGGADAPPPAASAPAPGGAAAPGLDTVPLQFSFTGGFFDLADFFHEMKRFVYVANGHVKVQGRLLTIDSFKFDSTAFPALKTEVQATAYLSPKEQGVTAGATPTGPTPSATPAAPAQAGTPPAAAPETATPANSTEGIQ